MKDVAQPAIDLDQLILAQEALDARSRFLSWGAPIQVDGAWVEVRMEALRFSELLADGLGALESLLRPLPHILIGHQGAEHDEFEQHPELEADRLHPRPNRDTGHRHTAEGGYLPAVGAWFGGLYSIHHVGEGRFLMPVRAFPRGSSCRLPLRPLPCLGWLSTSRPDHSNRLPLSQGDAPGALEVSAGIDYDAAKNGWEGARERGPRTMPTKAELQTEVERLRKMILEMHRESERWRRLHFDKAGHPSSDWQDRPPPV